MPNFAWEKGIPGAGLGAISGFVTGGPWGAIVGAGLGAAKGFEGGVPELKELGLMSPKEYEQYLSGIQAKVRMEGTRQVARNLAARGALSSGEVASYGAELENSLGQQKMTLMGAYEQGIKNVGAQLQMMKSAEQKQFWGGIIQEAFSILGSRGMYAPLQAVAQKALGAAQQETMGLKGGRPEGGWAWEKLYGYKPTGTLGYNLNLYNYPLWTGGETGEVKPEEEGGG